MDAKIDKKGNKCWKKGMPKMMLKFDAEKNEKNGPREATRCRHDSFCLAMRGGWGRLETSLASLMPCNLTRSPPRRGAADF